MFAASVFAAPLLHDIIMAIMPKAKREFLMLVYFSLENTVGVRVVITVDWGMEKQLICETHKKGISF